MTSHTDEIANLRATLEHIGQFIRHERESGDPTDANYAGDVMRAIEKMVKDGLKAPRASKVVTVTIGEGLPPTSYP